MNTLKVLGNYFIIALAFCSATPLRESSEDLIESRNTGNVQFYLYTKANPKIPQQLFFNDVDSVNNSNFNRALQIKILIHGWYSSSTLGPIRDAYLANGDYNLISVDWIKYATLHYISARNKVPVVGADIAEFLDFLNEKFEISFDSIVVIGHSLGAHVAGYCGKLLKRGKLSSIVGLDPASPLYSYGKPESRLSSTDANYVETIQTNGKINGFLKPIGTASFYPNWGRFQPGCGLDIRGKCSHERCISLYVDVIKGYSFAPIYKCNSFNNVLAKNGCNKLAECVKMGDPTQIEHKSGIYYFTTRDKPPFGHLSSSKEEMEIEIK